jgi:uncharacterized protein YcbX
MYFVPASASAMSLQSLLSRMDKPTVIVAAVTIMILSKPILTHFVGAVEKLVTSLQLQNLLKQQQQNDESIIATVSAIYIHPVKSMQAISLTESTLDNKGLKNDRRFMVVYQVPLPPYKTEWGPNDTQYRFLTQRQCPSLATISATLANNGTRLELNAPSSTHASLLRIPLDQANQPIRTSTASHYLAGIWDDTVLVQDMGDEAAAWIQAMVDADDDDSALPEGTRVRLVRHTVNDRAADPNYTPAHAKTWWGSTPLVSLTDGFPILIASEASLAHLNDRLKDAGKATVPMSRFRPNIVVRGNDTNSKRALQAFDEDKWKIIAIRDVMFALVKACPRCKQSCTDQTTGKVTDEPVKTMKTFRALGEGSAADDVFFAQNAIPLSGPASMAKIKVGDPVRVLKFGEPIYR